jgi:hypothetical protein
LANFNSHLSSSRTLFFHSVCDHHLNRDTLPLHTCRALPMPVGCCPSHSRLERMYFSGVGTIKVDSAARVSRIGHHSGNVIPGDEGSTVRRLDTPPPPLAPFESREIELRASLPLRPFLTLKVMTRNPVVGCCDLESGTRSQMAAWPNG